MTVKEKNPVGYPKGLPWSDERRERFITSGNDVKYKERMAALGKVTTDQQRERMRAAKLGVAKTPEQCAAMSNSHKQRWEWYAEVKAEFPELKKSEVWRIVRRRYYK